MIKTTKWKWRCLAALGALLVSTSSYAETVLVTNIKGKTLNKTGDLVSFSSMLIDDGKVVSLNPNPNNADTVIDGQGNYLLPGLIDAHGHLLGLGANLLEVNLRDSTSAEDAVKSVQEYVFANPNQAWITGRGWNQELWSDKAFPTAADLDSAIKNKPVWLTRVDGHAGWANSKALELAGITPDTPSPAGGLIAKDSEGNLTGIVIDNAMALIEKHIPKADATVYSNQLNAAGQHLLSLGITSMHDAGVDQSVYEFYLAQAAQSKLPLRVYAMLSATDPNLKMMLGNGIVRSSDDMLFVRSVKAYGDGALGSRGAALIKPYSDAPRTHGLLLTQPEDMDELYTTVLGSGFQLNYHAIGDRANRLALDAFERTFKTIDADHLRHRIEHAQVINVDDIKRFVALGILPSMQPTHATSDMNMAVARIGKNRMAGAYAWKTLLESGIALPLGSDFPVELANPFYGLHAAVTRQNRENQPVKGWYEHEALTIEQAFKGFTLDAAYGGHMEDTIGSLEPGKWADFILVDQDIFSVPASDIWKTHVIQTWIAGNKVFDANQ